MFGINNIAPLRRKIHLLIANCVGYYTGSVELNFEKAFHMPNTCSFNFFLYTITEPVSNRLLSVNCMLRIGLIEYHRSVSYHTSVIELLTMKGTFTLLA